MVDKYNRLINFVLLVISGFLFGIGYLFFVIYNIMKGKYDISISYFLGPFSILLFYFVFKEKKEYINSSLISIGFLLFLIFNQLFFKIDLYQYLNFFSIGLTLV